MSIATTPIYQLKITLNHIEPPIWRQVLVSGEITLAKLHKVIQEAMGWENSHLHIFIIKDENYTAPLPGDPYHLVELRAKSSSRVKLNSLKLVEGDSFTYEYDFGSSWEHTILIEKILPADPMQQLPVCVQGARACPPEDVGGTRRYQELVEIVGDAEDYIDWMGRSFRPEFFDRDAVNKRLMRIK